MKKGVSQTKKKTKGITLIALIITIIVLLILAGVSIATLTGENGVFNKASQAGEETKRVEIIEKARLDILQMQTENKSEEITAEQLKKILEKYFDDVPKELPQDLENLELIAKDEYGKYQIKVLEIWNGKFVKNGSSDLSILDLEKLEIGTAINVDKYGCKVDYLSKYEINHNKTINWRLFYQDNQYSYLIADTSVGAYNPSDFYHSYENGSFVSTVGQKLNPMLLKEGIFFNETNTNENIKAVAWLTDTNYWSEYRDEGEKALFAIGGPTIELYQSSYNATASMNSAPKMTLTVEKYGYRQTPVIKEIKTSYNNRNL